ncbi:MAG: energy-coupling factor transporter transmembrane protein EcfT [Treponemataceae bacterium]|nr:energy-coupling factor transporter transmembrane protein EcfT [Treponemataceae bacterium]
MYDQSAFTFIPGKGFLYQIKAGWKLAGLFVLSVLSLWRELSFLFSLDMVLLFLVYLSRLSLKNLFGGAKGLFITLGIILFVQSLRIPEQEGYVLPLVISYSALVGGLPLVVGVITTYLGAAMVYTTTPLWEMRRLLENIEGRLFPKRRSWISFALAMVLAFIPRIFELWQETETAYVLRGGKRGIQELLVLLPLMLERLFQEGSERSAAMECRGF